MLSHIFTVLAVIPICNAAVFGWPEIIGCLVIVLILIGARHLPGLSMGLGRGLREFRKSSREVQEQLGISAEDAGRSVGGIYGKPAAEGLTHDNQVAEFYSIPPRDGAHSAPMTFSDKLVVFIAQGFGIGRIPFAPGTWGSLLGILLTAVLSFVPPHPTAFVVIAGMLVFPAVWICGIAEHHLGKDPGSVVLDEIVAMPLCFLVPILSFNHWWSIDKGFPGDWIIYFKLFTGFLLFRLFDIWKPWPVRQSQSLPGGWGVVMDDVLAAVYVNLVALALYAIAYFLR